MSYGQFHAMDLRTNPNSGQRDIQATNIMTHNADQQALHDAARANSIADAANYVAAEVQKKQYYIGLAQKAGTESTQMMDNTIGTRQAYLDKMTKTKEALQKQAQFALQNGYMDDYKSFTDQANNVDAQVMTQRAVQTAGAAQVLKLFRPVIEQGIASGHPEIAKTFLESNKNKFFLSEILPGLVDSHMIDTIDGQKALLKSGALDTLIADNPAEAQAMQNNRAAQVYRRELTKGAQPSQASQTALNETGTIPNEASGATLKEDLAKNKTLAGFDKVLNSKDMAGLRNQLRADADVLALLARNDSASALAAKLKSEKAIGLNRPPIAITDKFGVDQAWLSRFAQLRETGKTGKLTTENLAEFRGMIQTMAKMHAEQLKEEIDTQQASYTAGMSADEQARYDAKSQPFRDEADRYSSGQFAPTQVKGSSAPAAKTNSFSKALNAVLGR